MNDGRTDGGRRIHWYTISSPCEPNGSGELKIYMQELPFLHSARRLMLINICMKFLEDSLRGFQVTEQTRFVTDSQTDARGKTICLPALMGGDIITMITCFVLYSFSCSLHTYSLGFLSPTHSSADVNF